MPRIAVNGIEVNYIDEGEGDVLLLIHNLTSDITGFDDNIPELSKHFRVIAPDIRGHGFTTHCEDYDKAKEFYTFDNIVEDFTQLLDHLKIDKFFLFGQAYWGANIALHFYQRHAKRVRGLIVASSYIISTEPGVPTHALLGEKGNANFIRMHKLAREKGMMAVYDDRLQYGQFWSEKLRSDKRILAKYAEAHKRTSPVAFVTIPHISHDRRAEIVKVMKEDNVPFMLLLGADDSNNEQCITEFRQDLPDVHIALIPEAGHYPTAENPLDFNRTLLDFYAGAARYANR
jgi:pimeloyl-ACP methyl ester carboxylesterase